MIEGVIVKEMKRIPDDRGKILHIMKSSDSEYDKFGEVYCSTVYPGIVKGWHLHTEMTLNYVVLKGKIKIELPKTTDIEKLTKEEAVKMIAAKMPKKKAAKKKKAKNKRKKKK